MKTIQPYSHDCKSCVWVGWFSPWVDKPPMNVYLCDKTVIIRFSDEPSDYWSATAGESARGPTSTSNAFHNPLTRRT
jgi:hypothetical protein